MKIVRLEDAQEWPDAKELSPEQLKEAYALARAAFTADDLAKCTEIEGGVPMDSFLAELEQAQQDHDRQSLS